MENTNAKLNGESPPVKKKCVAWKTKTKLEKYLIVLCIAILIAFLIMIGVVLYLEHVYTRPKPKICNSALCRAQAGKIMSYMDFDVEPCEDFYKFACGSFSKVTVIPNNEIRYATFNIARERINKISRELLEADEDSEDPDFINKVKQRYKACLESETETSNIIKQLQNKTGFYHWPILEHDDEHISIEKSISLVDIFGNANPFYGIHIETNETMKIIFFYSGDVFASESVYLNDTDETYIRRKQKYRDLIIYTLFKADTPLEDIDSEVDKLLDFETSFAKVTNASERENETKSTIKEFAADCKEIGWLDIMKHAYDYFGHAEDFDEEEIIIKTKWKGYFEDLCKLVGDTDPRIVYNYLVWRFLASHLSQFDSYFERSYQEILGHQDYLPSSKSERCLHSLQYSAFDHSFNYLVIKHLNPYKTIEEVERYDVEIKEVMDRMFSETSWLDETSKDIAKRRLWNISADIGYSSNSVDVGLLEKYYSQINVTNNYIDDYLNDQRNNRRQHLFNDTFSINIEVKIHVPLEVGAFFVGDRFVILLGTLQPPFYVSGAPKYINYPVVPYIIAHELSHAFDSLERDNDEDNSTEAWPEATIESFKERMECYVNQYSQYPLDDNGTKVDGNQTIRDNIADNSGVVQAYSAYEKYVLSNTEEPRLPGLDYTPQQLFFINFAQCWCQTILDPIKVFENDVHSPGRYRVIGTLQNFPRFSETFSCPIGSPMNPKDKCTMWG